MRIFWLLWLLPLAYAQQQDTLLTWLGEKGGFVHEALEIRPDNPWNPNSRRGVFSRASIPAGTLLFDIPQAALLSTGPPQPGMAVQVFYNDDSHYGTVESYDNNVWTVQTTEAQLLTIQDAANIRPQLGNLQCTTIQRLASELQRGTESPYAPYVLDLMEQSPTQLPSAWSVEGRELLERVLSDTFPPFGLDGYDYADECGDDEKNDYLDFASLLQIQRSWDDVLIPVLDLLSHRNGRLHLNTNHTSVHWSRDVQVYASIDIASGDEVVTSYNFCTDCEGRAYGYGTPEIVRDYGFVEDFPQRWFFDSNGMDIGFALDTVDGQVVVNWLHEGEFVPSEMEYLEQELQRLDHLAYKTGFQTPEQVPPAEWQVIYDYLHASIFALQHALEAIRGCPDETCSLGHTRYDALDTQDDDLPYNIDTCEFARAMEFDGYSVSLETVQTPYQTMELYHHPDTLDTCFQLDSVVQICGCYRPHYHEMVVHYTARFLPSIRRVVWVGGGDSMLLHEIVQYPHLELAVGLEIDQTVTRKSFRHFGTQPHWDDPRVEWWYGDAAKSLVMLPEEYYGSFDLVLVDLSETVMSISVTDGLDIMGALSLLLQPKGILVKNELYFSKMSELFEYTMELNFYDVPVICAQTLILGSNAVDFRTTPPTDHGVDPLWKRFLPAEVDNTTVSFDSWHGYRRNLQHKRPAQDLDLETIPAQQEKSPGILLVLEVEDVTTPNVEAALMQALDRVGMKQLFVVETAMIFDQGYLVARCHESYCGLDVHLWSAFDQLPSLQTALVEALGGRASNRYRVVAGGMFGLPTWQADWQKRGPQPPKEELRDEDPAPVQAMDLSVVVQATVKALGMIPNAKELVALVVCGKDDECPLVRAMQESPVVESVLVVHTCDNVQGVNEYSPDVTSTLYACEQAVVQQLEAAYATSGSKIDVIALDSSVTMVMGQIILRVFQDDVKKYQFTRFTSQSMLVLAPSASIGAQEDWRRNMLDRFRRDIIRIEPAFLVEAYLNSTDSSMKMAFMSSGVPEMFDHLRGVVGIWSNELSLVTDVRNANGALFTFQDDFDPTNFFLPDAYNQTGPLQQWKSQNPRGSQTLYQLEAAAPLYAGDRIMGNFQGEGQMYPGVISSTNGDGTFNIQYDDGDREANVGRSMLQKQGVDASGLDKEAWIQSSQVKTALAASLKIMKDSDMDSAEIHPISGIGEGTILFVFWKGGNLVVLFDGRKHVDLNLYTHEENEVLHEYFKEQLLDQLPMMALTLHDKQPRGSGRVVNFKSDCEPRDTPHWAKTPTQRR